MWQLPIHSPSRGDQGPLELRTGWEGVWKLGQVQRKAEGRRSVLLVGSRLLWAPWLHELGCWLGFKWAAREISSNPS